jgi:4-hydroxy-tetrahydrodipicolinate reductase
MDALPVMLAGVCRDMTAVTVHRAVDAARRRGNLQRKIGAGMTVEQFAAAAETGRFGHVGLAESVALVAAGLGWELDEIAERLDPLPAEREVETAHVRVAAGQVAGLHQRAAGRRDGRERIVMELQMAVGHPQPRDAVEIDGDPPVQLQLPGGVAGDAATVGRLINALEAVQGLTPGLRTVLDLPPVCTALP